MKTRTQFSILFLFASILFGTGIFAQPRHIDPGSISVNVSESVAARLNGDVPHTISYQGVLRNAHGAMVSDGEYRITATIYNAEGKSIWRGTYASKVVGGTFNLVLGSGDYPLPTVRALDAPLWIGIRINDGEEVERSPLTAVPYSLNVADSSITAQKISTDYIKSISINGEKLSGTGREVNIVTSDGITAAVDPTTSSIMLKSNASNVNGQKGGSIQADASVTNLTVTANAYLNTASGQTYLGKAGALKGTLNFYSGSGSNYMDILRAPDSMTANRYHTLPSRPGDLVINAENTWLGDQILPEDSTQGNNLIDVLNHATHHVTEAILNSTALDAMNITTQGNSFNGPNQLVKLDDSSRLIAFGDIDPDTDNAWDLGADTKRWRDAYIARNVNVDGVYMIGGETVMADSGSLSIGVQAGSVGSGLRNVFLGDHAGHFNSGGHDNLFSGEQSGLHNVTGSGNTFTGEESGFTNATGSSNVFSGYRTGFSNIGGSGDAFIGAAAGASNTAGSDNTFLGHNSGMFNLTGNFNTFVGSGLTTPLSTTNATYGSTLGANASVAGNSITNATAVGAYALVTQSNSLVLGSIKGTLSAPLSTKVGIGTTAPLQALDVEGSPATGQLGNIQFSHALMPAGNAGLSGQVLVSSGSLAPPSWLSPSSLIASAAWMLGGNTNPSPNVFGSLTPQDVIMRANSITVATLKTSGSLELPPTSPSGAGILTQNGVTLMHTFGTDNFVAGSAAGNLTMVGTGNTYIGRLAGAATTGGFWNAFVGEGAGQSNTNGAGNTFLGEKSGSATNVGFNNTFSGFRAGLTNSIGNNNTALGANADVGGVSLTNASALGSHASVTQDNSLVLGSINTVNGATADAKVGIGTTAPTQKLEIKNGNLLLSNSSANVAGQLQFMAPINPVTTTFEAVGPQTTNIRYYLPPQQASTMSVLVNPGSGFLAWYDIANLINGAPCPGTSLGQMLEWNGTQWCISPTLTNVNGALIDQNGVGTNPNLGTGSRMMWLPDVSAFRAGAAFGANWDAGSVGTFSVAIGDRPTASGDLASVALGQLSHATGRTSVAIGQQPTASAEAAVALGSYTVASAEDATATGSYSVADMIASTAIGNHTRAHGFSSTSMGDGSYSDHQISTAMGDSTVAQNDFATSMGSRTRASGVASTVMGSHNTASGTFSTIAGGSNLTVGDYSFGFNGNSTGAPKNIVSSPQTAYFGDVDLWLGNLDNNARQLRFYEPSGSGAFYSSFKAGNQAATINYTLPILQPTGTTVLTDNGFGILSWQDPCALLANCPNLGGNDWHLIGNTSTIPGSNDGVTPATNFIGTIDNKAFEIHVNNSDNFGNYVAGSGRVMRYEPGLGGPNIIGGYNKNWVTHDASGNVFGATIAGGGQNGTLNRVTDNYGTIGGGSDNQAGDNAGNTNDQDWATVSGGESNTAAARQSAIGGGYGNTIYGYQSAIAGGNGNLIDLNGTVSGIGGGSGNHITGAYSFIGGGDANIAANVSGVVSGRSNSATNYSFVGGGSQNQALGIGSGIGAGWFNVATGYSAFVGGGLTNTAAGDFSAIPGGMYLKVGAHSLGFNGTTASTLTDVSSASFNPMAYLGNVDLWLGNVDGSARQLRFYAPNTSLTYSAASTRYTSFVASGSQVNSNIQYTLPPAQGAANSILVNNGAGALSWQNFCQMVDNCLSGSSLFPCPGTQTGDLLEWDGSQWCVSPTMTNKDGSLVDIAGAGVNPNLGHSARMMWIPSQAAFRAGDINAGDDGNSWGNSGSEWDDPNVGYGSAAFGQGTQASGNHSFAAGYSVFATGVHGVAFGANGTTASGNNTVALGSGVYASGDNGIAMGCGSYASGLYSTAMGNNSFASGMHSTSIGDWARAQGQTSIAAGEQVTAAGNYSLATGAWLKVGDYSFGFNGMTTTSATDVSAFPRTAYLGNVNLWIGNTDNTSRQLRFYSPNTSLTYSGSKYTSFEAQPQSLNITYQLPNAQGATNTVLTNNGSGTLSWVDPCTFVQSCAGNLTANEWHTTGNASTTAGTNFLGTTDNQPFEIHANNAASTGTDGSGRVWRVEPKTGASSSPNIIGGYQGNAVSANVVGGTVSGGGSNSNTNRVTTNFSTVAGGYNNTAGDGGTPTGQVDATVSGGYNNRATGRGAVIGGGESNVASGLLNATVAGGLSNIAQDNYTTVGGGQSNWSIGLYSTVSGGTSNRVMDEGSFIGGGIDNRILGQYSAIPGGRSLRIGGHSFGFNALAVVTDVSAFSNIAYFGDADLWIGNVDGVPHALKFFAPNTNTSYTGAVSTSFVASASQATNIPYTLPPAQGAANTVLTNNGSGTLSWQSATPVSPSIALAVTTTGTAMAASSGAAVGTDASGKITFSGTIGTGTVTVPFNTTAATYTSAPTVVLTPANAAAAYSSNGIYSYYVTSNPTSFTINVVFGSPGATGATFNYIVMP